jgi:hypothetical protein
MEAALSPRSDIENPTRHILRMSTTLLMLGIFAIQVGCSRSPEAAPWAMEQAKLLNGNIISRQVEEAREVNGHLERYGRLMVQTAKSAPRAFSFFLSQQLARGEGETRIEIKDEETGQTTSYVINDESGEAWIHTEKASLPLVFNADKTVKVGDQFAENEQQAAELIHKTGVLEEVSDSALMTLLDIVAKYVPESDTARGTVVVTIIVVVWLTGSWYLCSREYSRNGCKITNGMSQYCRDYCRQVGCSCW